MSEKLRKFSSAFSAGALGGLTSSIVVWGSGAFGVTARYGVSIEPSFTPEWLYPRIVWGGVWAWLFCLPALEGAYLLRGLIYSLIPAMFQLFVVYPIKAQKGLMGMELGAMAPVFVLVYNLVWGLSTALWLKFVEK